jgi:AcrR family transcriptional regulator
MNEEKEKILRFASQKFMKEGFYKTTMDEISAEMHMSKKTIYRNFSSKEDLVGAVAKKFFNENVQMIDQVLEIKYNAVEKLVRLFEVVGSIIVKVNDKILSDIHHYAPEHWKEIDEYRTKKMNSFLTDIISQGQKEGYFLKKRPEILIAVFIASIRAVVNPEFTINNQFTMLEALKSTIEILMNGILTEKGKKIFKKLNYGVKK